MRRISFHEAADSEIHEAISYYSDRGRQTARAFEYELLAALNLIMEFPELGSLSETGERSVLLRRFPFKVIYTVGNFEIVIIAVAHQRRKPGYWSDRYVE